LDDDYELLVHELYVRATAAVESKGEPQKAGHFYVTSNYECFSLEGLRVPVDRPYFAAKN
jgi:hypothetical protein